MIYSNGLEYILNSGLYSSNSGFSYLAKNADDRYTFHSSFPIFIEPRYAKVRVDSIKYSDQPEYLHFYLEVHSFLPELFLSPSRPKTQFVDDKSEIIGIVEEAFQLMLKEKLPENVQIKVLPLNEFKSVHSTFGPWNNGILGFSINGKNKKIFVREDNLDSLMIVIGHEIGHVLTDSLPNKHDGEVKAFAFSIEWARIIKKYNVANLGLSIKDEIDFQPARNGLHDVAFADFLTKSGRKGVELHQDLVKGYISVFDKIYFHPK